MGLADKTIEGLGDITLSALWYPWIGEAGELRSLGFSAGLILPTGDSGGSQAGISIPSVFQLGTGAYQATLGIRYAKSIDDWTFATSADVLFPLNESSEGFRPATTIFGSASVAHALTDSLSGRLALSYSSGGRDEFQGVAYSNTGSTTLSLAPSLIWQINEDYSASASISIPLYRDVNATAIAAGPLFRIGLSRSF
ncbi:transporter [Akkermansiaceae bacterium]|nr:transporter [bacterium]MDB4693684.1 transporter [Akkermansiaceae bacterium]MDB4708889.1 transporter [Akkermansiaceae bacterium]MDC1405477.1 transporter [Akkermansiaceae bacterium]